MPDAHFPRYGRDFSAGEVLFREGERGEEMYVIQSGLVRVVKRVGGEYRSLATLGRGEFVGEMAILNGRPRTATALVLEDARCLVIDAATLEHMLSENTEIALRLVKKLAQRLDSADEMIQMLLNPDPQARVLLALRRHAESYGDETPRGVRLHGSAVDIARDGGVDGAQVRDVLARLTRMRVTTEDENGAIVVTDLPRLMEFMEFLDLPRKSES
jgi:CRP/FNR family transcriptional regulator, cyclic AMP receptor protein